MIKMSDEWVVEAEKDAGMMELVRFTADFPSHVLSFPFPPKREIRKSRYRNDEEYVVYIFQVIENRKAKELHATGQLLRALIRYAKEKGLVGSTVKITRTGFANATAYQIEPAEKKQKKRTPVEEFDDDQEGWDE